MLVGVLGGGMGEERAVEPEYHFLGRRTAEPICLRAVGERDIFGCEAPLFGECWICYVEVCARMPVLMD